jgi:hypothetical protein
MRFAGKALQYLKDVALPQGGMNVALEYGGNALGALMTGAMFGGGDLGKSLAIGGEDLAIGLLGSVGGRAAGDTVARKLFKVADPQKRQMAQLAGSMPLEMGLAVLSPRPILEGEMARQQQQQAVQGELAARAPEEAAKQQVIEPRQQEAPAGGGFEVPAVVRQAQAANTGDPVEAEIRRLTMGLLEGQSPQVRAAVVNAMGLG